MTSTKHRVLPVLIAGLFVSGCMFDKKVQAPPMTASNTIRASLPAIPPPVRSLATRPVPVATTYTPSVYPTGIKAGSDLIAVQDLLEITVYKVPDLTRELRVGTNGQITFPLIGAVAAKGRNPAQLEQVIEQKLGATYMNDPQVTVVVKESVQNRVTVEGAVGKPGVYPVVGSMTVLQAVALAGGLNEKANAQGAVLLRRSAAGQVSQQPIDIAAIHQGRMQDLMLLQDDRIVIPKQTVFRRFTVSGAVPSPGIFELQDGMTFTQAMAMAGGLTRLADKEQALLLRRDQSGHFRRYKINLKQVLAGRAADPEMGMDDRIIVLESRTRAILDDVTRYIKPPTLF